MNRSRKTHTLKMIPIPGIKQIKTTSTDCNSTFVLGYLQFCTLKLEVNGSKLTRSINGGPAVCQNGNFGQCYQPVQSLKIRFIPQPPTGKVSLKASVDTLGLSVACSQANPDCVMVDSHLMGTPRKITITNQGPGTTTNFTITPSGLPKGTTYTLANCGKVLKANDSCIITIVPGAVASADKNKTACTSGGAPTGSISASANGVTRTVNVYVLGYGCIYQDGYIYAIDDTTGITRSIGGKAITLNDQITSPPQVSPPPEAGIIWSSNGNGSSSGDESAVVIGTNQATTSPCIGGQDGICDTNLIVSYYNANREQGGPPPTPLSYYAAGICKGLINNHTDWYLPAICEMGPVTAGAGSDCPTGIQNVTNNLAMLIGEPNATTPSTSCLHGSNCLAGSYWSSTEANKAGYPPDCCAWFQDYDSSTAALQTNTVRACY